MNYEKKYKEALERARALIEANTSDALFHLKDIESIFPDLAESEDERIRKWCISHFKAVVLVAKNNAEYQEYLNNKVIPWLEKQGGQKPTWSKEDERLCQCLIKDQKKALNEVRNDKYGHSEIISDLKEMYNERIAWLKSLKEKLVVK